MSKNIRADTARVGIAFFYHESHSFSPLATDLSAFDAEDHHVGERVREIYADTRTELGGFLSALEARGGTAVPLTAAAAMPAGEVTGTAYDLLLAEFKSHLRHAHEQEPLDGLLLALHGSMVAETEQDPEGAIVTAARAVLGPDTPIAVTLDLHANVSATLAENGALIFGYQTHPHVDMYEQGQRAANAALDAIAGLPVYVRTVQLPMLLRSINMRTAEGPMADVVEFAREREGDGVYAVSPHSGFPYSDTECSGAAVSVVASSVQQAEALALQVAKYFWQQRHRYQVDLPGVTEGIASAHEAIQTGETPVVIADVADNPQSGGSADTTVLIRAALNAGFGDLMIAAIYDPEVVETAAAIGESGTLTTTLAGKSSAAFGSPLEVEAKVLAVSDGIFENDGPFNAGLTVDTGGAAWLRLWRVDGVDLQGSAVDVVVTGRPISANDPALYRHLGVDPTHYEVLVWKVKNHFRAAFEQIVGRVIPVDAPGPAQTDFTLLPFAHTDKSKWPFDIDRELGKLFIAKPKSERSAYEVTPATAEDLQEIAQFHVDVWKESYAGLMDADFLRTLSVGRRLSEWEAALHETPGYRILVARSRDGQLLGFASTQEHTGEGHLALELHTLNLKPEARGTGLAADLIMRLLADRPAHAWVVDGNERAFEFYRKVGFELTNDRRPDPESNVDDLRMVRKNR